MCSQAMKKTIRHFGILLSAILFFILQASQAAMPEKDYLKALRIAESKTARKKSLQLGRLGEANLKLNLPGSSQPGNSTQSWLKELLGSPYRIGDSWEVALWQVNRSMMRMTNEPHQLADEFPYFGIFRYEVTGIRTASTSEVTLQVSQIATEGTRLIDPRVSHITLTMTDEFTQFKKTYKFKKDPDTQSEGIPVSPEGIRSAMTPLEMLPLDIPDIYTAERKRTTTQPPLPSRVQEYAKKIQFSPNLEQSVWFEQEDFFGRPIQVLWQQGDPWPAYMKTSYGISLLVRKGNL